MGKPSPSVPVQPCNFPEGKQNFVDLPLSELDPEMHAIIEQEKQRQFRGGENVPMGIRMLFQERAESESKLGTSLTWASCEDPRCPFNV
jgi:hypothetical protein